MDASSDELTVFHLLVRGLGTINGVEFEATGDGRGDTSSGHLEFNATFSRVPEGLDPFGNLLGALILETTVFGREIGDAVNLMTLANGIFEFSQIVTGEGININSYGNVLMTGEREFTWNSQAVGQVHLKNVSEIEPFVAVMIPQGFGKFIETVPIPIIEQNRRMVIHLLRNFTFTPRSELRQPQLRDITVVPMVEGLKVSVDIMAAMRTFTS